jgi:hypothetical protein
MEPAVDRLIAHVDENSDFVSPTVDRPEPPEETEAADESDEPDDEAADEAGDRDGADERAEAGR